jgi:hypothetical protein
VAAIPRAVDLAAIERLPLRERGLPASTYALVRRAADLWPDRPAVVIVGWRPFGDGEIAAAEQRQQAGRATQDHPGDATDPAR